MTTTTDRVMNYFYDALVFGFLQWQGFPQLQVRSPAADAREQIRTA